MQAVHKLVTWYLNHIYNIICQQCACHNLSADCIIAWCVAYRGEASVVKTAYPKVSEDVIWLDNVRCEGTEPSVEECKHHDWGTNNCDHDEDVYIKCYK